MEKLSEVVYLEEAIKFDNDCHTFRNLKILGAKSDNHRNYAPKGMESAVKFYENKAVYTNHKTKEGVRDYGDRSGTIINPRYVQEENNIRGDFLLNPKHHLAEQIKWDIEHNVPGVGFSHEAYGKPIKQTDGSLLIEEITSVDAVCIVCEPATTISFHESKDNDLDKLFESKLEELFKEVKEIKEGLKTLSKEPIINKMDLTPEPLNKSEIKLSDWVKQITSKRI